MRVDVWSDVVCPWCYIGKRHLEQALAGFEHRDDVVLTWHSYQLDPGAPMTTPGDYVTPLAAKFDRSQDDVRAMLADMTVRAARDGLEYRFDIAHHANTFDAHRLLHLAAAHGVQDALKERLFAAVFTEGRTVSDPGTLQELGAAVGLDAAVVSAVLAGDDYADGVRADIEQAREYGITGVPFFVIDGRYGVSGAQPSEVLGRALEQAWDARALSA
jgi:predicted DsbA family dithiol-disulfide isomerase